MTEPEKVIIVRVEDWKFKEIICYKGVASKYPAEGIFGAIFVSVHFLCRIAGIIMSQLEI